MNDIFWFGARESDIVYTDNLFAGSITLYGSGEESNIAFCNESPIRINHNIITEEQDNFTIQQINALMQKNPNARCMFYNPHIFYNYKPLAQWSSKVLCLNDKEILAITDDKIKFRELMNGSVPFLNYHVHRGKIESFEALCEIMGEGSEYVVQAPVSCGGCGTFVVRSHTFKDVFSQIADDSQYLLMRYEAQAISVNTHAVIYDNDVVLSPGSVQIVREIDNRLIYKGADFITYGKTDRKQREIFRHQCEIVCSRLQEIGYRGIVGIDGMFTSDGLVYLSEVNGRFQASTPLINKALSTLGRPSLHKMNIDAFTGGAPSETERDLDTISVPYSNYVFSSSKLDYHPRWFKQKCECEDHLIELVGDGYNEAQPKEQDAYLFKAVFDTNITSISPDNTLQIYQNIAEPNHEFYDRIKRKDKLSLKIALLNQGVYISDAVLDWFSENGGIRPATNSAVDVQFPSLDDMVVNCPRSLKFTRLTPFSIEIRKPYGLCLFYYGQYITKIKLWTRDPFEKKTTKAGTPYEDVAYLSTDRLRLHHTSQCIYKRQNMGCKFCDIQPCESCMSSDDLDEIVSYYTKNISKYQNNGVALRHFLVGGQSDVSEKEYNAILETIRIIRKYSNQGIYVMCLPPDNLSVIDQMHEFGATEVAFNIEIFDSIIAQKIMPGKGGISRHRYYRALEHAVRVFGKNGNVRSLVVVGLETTDSLLNGLKQLIDIGVQPVLSVFRPLPETALENTVPPSNEYLYSLFKAVDKYCQANGAHLGPDCKFCQNNTLSLPYNNDNKYESV